MAGFKIHDVIANSASVKRLRGLLRFLQNAQIDAKAGVGFLGASDGLKHQIHRRASFHHLNLVGHMGENARLRGDAIARNHVVNQICERNQRGNTVGRWIDANHCVARAIKQAVNHARCNAARIVGGVIRLQANRQAVLKADGVSKRCHHAAFTRDDD